ncbi:MAG: hypothetical protein OXQ94_14700 [Gemmatimonadota bacterium]|nr:hypothetical protein [Gemmatimonadota bacterium]MDE2872924.1 hypothetical protein [Gemmatimonadota bacterium]
MDLALCKDGEIALKCPYAVRGFEVTYYTYLPHRLEGQMFLHRDSDQHRENLEERKSLTIAHEQKHRGTSSGPVPADGGERVHRELG